MSDNQETSHFLDYWRVIRSRKEIVIAVFLLTVIVGAGVTYYMPRVYMASAVMQVTKPSADLPVFSREPMFRYDPLFLRTQFQIIQSRPIVEEAVKRLGLNEKLGRAYGYYDILKEKSFDRTVKLVSKSVKVQQYRDTNLIEVQAYLAKPEDEAPRLAAEIANAIVEVYRDQASEKSRVAKEAALQAMQDELTKQKKIVADLEEEVEDIRKKHGLTFLVSREGSSDSIEKREIVQINDLRLKTRMELEEMKARYETIISLPADELLDAAIYLVDDPALAALVLDKRKAEIQLSRLTESLGLKHPDVVQVQQGINQLKLKVDEALRGLVTGVKANYDAVKAKFDVIEAEANRLRQTDISAESGAYLEFDRASEELGHARSIRDQLEAKYLRESIELRIPQTTVEFVSRSKAPDARDPVRPKPFVNIALSIVLGIMAGVALAYFLEYLDTSIKTIDEIEKIMGAPVVGVLPQRIKPLIDKKADPAHAEGYRVLRTNIQFSKRFAGGKTLCCTSGSVGEGKSLTLFNLACVCAQIGDRTLIVDSDLHRPRQHKILSLTNSIGLANVLVGDVSLEDAVVSTNVTNLDFLSSGQIEAPVHGLLNSRIIKDLIKELKDSYDYVFFDAPPAIGVSDASQLVSEMDGVLFVVQHRKYPKALSIRARDMIHNIGGNMIGVVLNNINISKDYSAYYYQQHYTYYPQKSGKQRS
jgi:capsular exopolysaccharide synthesis family protein